MRAAPIETFAKASEDIAAIEGKLARARRIDQVLAVISAAVALAEAAVSAKDIGALERAVAVKEHAEWRAGRMLRGRCGLEIGKTLRRRLRERGDLNDKEFAERLARMVRRARARLRPNKRPAASYQNPGPRLRMVLSPWFIDPADGMLTRTLTAVEIDEKPVRLDAAAKLEKLE